MAPYYSVGDTSGSIAAPIILDQVSVSGGIFLGNISLTLTASTYGAGVSGSSSGNLAWPLSSASIHYLDSNLGTWQPIQGTDGGMKVVSSPSSPVYVTGNLAVIDPEIALPNATVSMVAASVSSVLLSAANSNRKQLSVYNSAVADLYIKFASVATTESFSIKIPPSGYFELTTTNGVYTGPLAGIWRTATQGSASITEVIG